MGGSPCVDCGVEVKRRGRAPAAQRCDLHRAERRRERERERGYAEDDGDGACRRCGDPAAGPTAVYCASCRVAAHSKLRDAVCGACGRAPATVTGTCLACIRRGHVVWVDGTGTAAARSAEGRAAIAAVVEAGATTGAAALAPGPSLGP